jgi:hypothetical protein
VKAAVDEHHYIHDKQAKAGDRSVWQRLLIKGNSQILALQLTVRHFVHPEPWNLGAQSTRNRPQIPNLA